MPLTRKQKKIARVAEPRNKITAADFKKLRQLWNFTLEISWKHVV